jgi:GTP cyclohydrolase I
MTQRLITPAEVLAAARQLADRLQIGSRTRIWGVPRGGVPVALAIGALTGAELVDSLSAADVVVDDIWDSGRTAARYEGIRFGVLFDKRTPEYAGQWLVMPWETTEEHDASAEDAVVRLLQFIGEDPTREGLRQTPTRVVKAWAEACSGYGQSPADVLKTFEDGADRVNELVVMRGIPVYSTCEHHLIPFFGTATIGYIPDGKIIGLSKLVRLTNVFAKRLQVQERLTNEIADALMEHLTPVGVGVIIECRHMCMESRGVHAPNTPTTTSALRGALYDDARARAEFMALRK